MLDVYDQLLKLYESETTTVKEEKKLSENAQQNGGFRTDGYRTVFAAYDTDDFDINVEFDMQDEEEYEVENDEWLLYPGQTVADLVVYLSYKCGYTNVYVYNEHSAFRHEISKLKKDGKIFTTVPGNHNYEDYGTIEDYLVESY